MSGVILLDRRAGDRRQGPELRHRLQSGTRITAALPKPATTRRSARALAPHRASATRRSRRSRTRSWARTSCRSRPQELGSRRRRRRRAGARRASSASPTSPARSVGPTFGQTVAEQRDHRDHRLAAGDLGLHRAALRVEVRRAGADRADARPADHRRRLRADRPGGDDVDGRGAADHPGLLALRHDHRVRPRAREHAAHAARRVLADRQPLDVRGADAVAGDDLLDAAAGRSRCCCSAARR